MAKQWNRVAVYWLVEQRHGEEIESIAGVKLCAARAKKRAELQRDGMTEKGCAMIG